MDDKLEKILESDILVALNFCNIMNRSDQMKPLGRLLIQSTYLDYETLAWAVNQIGAEIMNVRVRN